MRVALYFVLLASAVVSCKQATTGPTPLSGPDTTSHNFLWTLDTLGDGNSSTLYDVAIINDTLAYAVGEISVRNSIGGYRTPAFNFAR